jgi:hypothetical protein
MNLEGFEVIAYAAKKCAILQDKRDSYWNGAQVSFDGFTVRTNYQTDKAVEVRIDFLSLNSKVQPFIGAVLLPTRYFYTAGEEHFGCQKLRCLLRDSANWRAPANDNKIAHFIKVIDAYISYSQGLCCCQTCRKTNVDTLMRNHQEELKSNKGNQ